MATVNWTGTSSIQFAVAANWDIAAPVAGDTANILVINPAHQPEIAVAGKQVGVLNIDGTNILTIKNAGTLAVIGAATIGSAVGGTGGTADVNGATANLSTASLAVGQNSHGALVIRNGGSVTSTTAITVGSASATGTIIIGGTGNGVSADGAGTLGSAVNLASAGSSLVFHTNNAASLSQVVSGTGSVLVNSAGQKVTLSGASTYSGGTTLSAGIAVAGVATVGLPGAITSSAFGKGFIGFDGGTLQAGVANLTIANAVVVDLNGGIIDNNGQQLTISGNITDAVGSTGGAVIFSNSVSGNQIILSGTNSYTGTTFINAGTTVTAAGSAITTPLSASSAFTINGSGATAGVLKLVNYGIIKSLAGTGQVTAAGFYTLTIAPASGTTTFSGQLVDTGPNGKLSLTFNGTGTQVLSGTSNTYTGATTVTSGTLQAGAANTFSAASATAVQASGILDLGNAAQTINNVSLSGGIIRNGTLTGAVFSTGGTIQASLAGASSLGAASGDTFLNGPNAYSGFTQVDASATLFVIAFGKLSANSAHTINGGLVLSGDSSILSLAGSGQVTTNLPAGTANLTIAPTSGSTTFSGVITENQNKPLSLTLNGTGTQVLSGANTYTGATTVTSGTLQAGKASAFSAASATNVQANGTLDLGGLAQTINSVSLAGGVISNGKLTGAVASTGGNFNAALTGASSLTALASGVLTFFGGANTHSGTTQINAGASASAILGSLSANSAHIVNGTLALNGDNIIRSLAGTGTVVNFLQAATLTIAASGAATTFSGKLVDANAFGKLSLTLNGPGTQVLSGANTYTGATTVTQGTLALSGAGTIASSAISVAAAGTFDISGISGTGVNVDSLAGAGTVKLGGKGLGIAHVASASTGLTFVGSGSGDAVFFDLATGNNAFSLVGTNFSNWNESLDSINLFANDGNDTVTGSSHNDTFVSGAGNDIFDGGAGTDTVVYSTTLASSQIVWNPGHPVDIFVKTGPSAGKFDSLTNMEFAKFSDQTISLAPVFAGDDGFLNAFGTTLHGNVLTNDTDPNGLPLSAVVKTGPSHGVLALLASGDFSYIANTGFVGQESFVYTASDSLGNFDTATVSINVTPTVPPGSPPPPPPPPAAGNFSVTDITTSVSSQVAGDAYSGPVAGLQHQFIYTGPDNTNVTAIVPNSFIHTGSGFDAIDVSAANGINVLDGGTNSNFLVGGKDPSGNDTFFVDDRSPPGDIWSTVGNFHAGDSATVFGITQNGFATDFVDGQGAVGFTGVTLHVTAPGVPTASLTLAGYSVADLSNGRLTTSFGTEADGTPYFFIHANS